MIPVDYKEAGSFVEMELLGKMYLYSDIRIKRETLPKGIYAYDLRHEDEDWGMPCEIQRHILVNYFGTIFTDEPIDLGKDGYIVFDSEKDFEGFTDKNVPAKDLKKYFTKKKKNK